MIYKLILTHLAAVAADPAKIIRMDVHRGSKLDSH